MLYKECILHRINSFVGAKQASDCPSGHIILVLSLSFFSAHCVLASPSLDLLGPPAQDCAPAAPPSPASEAGSLLPVQRHGADFTNVCVCPAGTLDGMHLVFNWTQGDRDQ